MKRLKLQFKVKSFLQRLWPGLMILSIWFVFASPYFLKGRVPYASDYQVNFFQPWSHYQEFWSPVKNNAMSDVHTQIYPWKKLTIESLKNREIPFWNPYSFAGTPHLANYQSAVFQPLNILFFFLPFIDAWSVLILLQPLMAGLFTYLFVREIGVSKTAALISAFSFMFSGFMVVWMAYGTLGYAILYLPLALWVIEKFLKGGRLRFLFVLALTVPLSFFSGHFQISFYFLTTVIFYLILRCIDLWRHQGERYPQYKIFKLLALFIFSLAAGLLISLPQLLPSYELYFNSLRRQAFQVGEVIPFVYLITVIAPDFFGNPVTRNDWFGHYAEWASFAGVWPFLFGVYGLVSRPKTRQVFFFAGVALLSLLYLIESPIPRIIADFQIPVISTSAFSRTIVLFSFSVSVLGGLGFDELIRAVERRETRKAGKFLVVLIVSFAAMWFMLLVSKPLEGDKLLIAQRNFLLPTALFLAGVLLMLISLRQRAFGRFFVLGWPVNMSAKVSTTAEALATAGFLFLVIFDGLRFATKWMPFSSRDWVYPDIPLTRTIRENIGQGRIFGNLGTEYLVYYGFPGVEGYDPLYIERYGEFLRSAELGEFQGATRTTLALARNGEHVDRVLDLLGVSLVYHPVEDTGESWAYPVWDKDNRYELVYTDRKIELYKNKVPMPRAVLFYDYEVIKNEREIIERFYSKEFDFRKTLLLESEPSEKIKRCQGANKSVVEIIDYTAKRVQIEVSTECPGLVFLSDNYYPTWKAKVNDKEVEVHRANYTFRAVEVPASRSRVEFYYEGWSL